MYNIRLELKKRKDRLQLPFKIILNSIYGKTGHKVNQVMGNLFNLVKFAFIIGYMIVQLYRCVIDTDLEKHVVSFATDPICTTKKLNINSNKLGEFPLDNVICYVFYLQNGIYPFNGKWKQRGFDKLKGKDIEHLDTLEGDGSLYYVYCRHL